VVWQGGETLEITALLNERLAAWRSQHVDRTKNAGEESSKAPGTGG
jgi:hypothetical protein